MTSLTEQSRPPRLAQPARPAKPLPLWRLLFAARRNAVGYWPDSAFDEKFFASRMGLGWTATVNDPEGIKHVLLDNVANYRKSRIARRVLKPGLGEGLLTAEGERWRRHRRILAPAFHPKHVAAFAPIITEASDAMLARWRSQPASQPLDIAGEMMALTLEIISRTMFSSDLGQHGTMIGQAITDYQERSGRASLLDMLNLPDWLPRLGPMRARRAIAPLDQAIEAVLARRRVRAEDKGDLLSMLLAARDEETGERLSDREIRDEVATIFTAGHETTANGLAWTWYLLSQHEEVRARLEAELARVLGGRLPTAADLPSLSYTRMIFDEAIRLYPPAHTMSREAIGPDVILGHAIPKGAMVIISPWLVHRHRTLWEEPDRFDPERFRPERAAMRPRFAYIPFGGGPRICIGMAFALQEAVLILATIAQHFRLRLKPGHAVELMGLITLRPKGGLPMLLEPRG
jgi:cytochrome P450